LGWRQANPLTPLNLISDQALSRSEHARAMLIGKLSQPKPTLAAAGRLLVICRILIGAADQGQLPLEQRLSALQRAAEVIAILGDAPDVDTGL